MNISNWSIFTLVFFVSLEIYGSDNHHNMTLRLSDSGDNTRVVFEYFPLSFSEKPQIKIGMGIGSLSFEKITGESNAASFSPRVSIFAKRPIIEDNVWLYSCNGFGYEVFDLNDKEHSFNAKNGRYFLDSNLLLVVAAAPDSKLATGMGVGLLINSALNKTTSDYLKANEYRVFSSIIYPQFVMSLSL